MHITAMDRSKRFSGRHVMITGAARGIGLEVARSFAREGAILSLLDYNSFNLTAFEKELNADGSEARGYHVDVSNRKDVAESVEKADAVQPIDVLINNAGVAFETPFLNIPEDEWRQVLDINLTGMFFVAQAVCRRLVVSPKANPSFPLATPARADTASPKAAPRRHGRTGDDRAGPRRRR